MVVLEFRALVISPLWASESPDLKYSIWNVWLVNKVPSNLKISFQGYVSFTPIGLYIFIFISTVVTVDQVNNGSVFCIGSTYSPMHTSKKLLINSVGRVVGIISCCSSLCFVIRRVKSQTTRMCGDQLLMVASEPLPLPLPRISKTDSPSACSCYSDPQPHLHQPMERVCFVYLQWRICLLRYPTHRDMAQIA